MMIEEKIARQRTYRNNINRFVGCLRPSFQRLSANLLKGA
jgi:hypothetical protein